MRTLKMLGLVLALSLVATVPASANEKETGYESVCDTETVSGSDRSPVTQPTLELTTRTFDPNTLSPVTVMAPVTDCASGIHRCASTLSSDASTSMRRDSNLQPYNPGHLRIQRVGITRSQPYRFSPRVHRHKRAILVNTTYHRGQVLLICPSSSGVAPQHS